MNTIVKTIAGIIFGGAVLGVVGYIAYKKGQTDAVDTVEKEEKNSIEVKTDEYDECDEHDDVDKKEQTNVETKEGEKKRLGLFSGFKNFVTKKNGILRKCLTNPESQKIEAFIDGDEIKITIKPKTS